MDQIPYTPWSDLTVTPAQRNYLHYVENSVADPDPLVRDTAPAPEPASDPSIIKQK
jgi:hypothetical protein